LEASVSTDPQKDVINYLMDPRTHQGADVERVDTHSAIVFIAGSRVLKLKRAVRFDYLDFSTEPLRRKACEAEVRINRAAAPEVYRGVVAVTREADGSLALNGQGPPVDWLVEMTRFDQEQLLDRLASRNALDQAMMAPLAAAIARFHAQAAPRRDHGGKAGMRWVVDGNATGLNEQGTGILDATRCSELTRRSRETLDAVGDLLDQRQQRGFVRQCHGDLHLRNIVLIERQPTLFDAVEFNDRISCIDVFYDLSFLLMDLLRRELDGHANTVLNAYLAETGDYDGLPLLPLFLSCRAAVRAKTSATAARLQPDETKSRDLKELARQYLTLAFTFLRPTTPRLLAIGGFSGTGKSTLARALAPSVGGAGGAVIIRSDEIRKALHGVPSLQRLGPEGYSREVTRDVYQLLRDRTLQVLRAGHSVIVDAVFADARERAAIEDVARTAGAPFDGIWLQAPLDVLVARTGARVADASDANPAVVRSQVQQDPGPISWHRIEAGDEPARVAARARAVAVQSAA
jgi:aminoglycoside phosphotransferase family enzyme/predicted kinase